MSSLRRGILHNAVQLDDGTWVWRHARWHGGAAGDAVPEAGTDAEIFADLSAVLGRVEVPVLLARGMRPDSVLRDDDEVALRRDLPSARVVHFENAGHSIQGDMPVELAATIEEFVA